VTACDKSAHNQQHDKLSKLCQTHNTNTNTPNINININIESNKNKLQTAETTVNKTQNAKANQN